MKECHDKESGLMHNVEFYQPDANSSNMYLHPPD